MRKVRTKVRSAPLWRRLPNGLVVMIDEPVKFDWRDPDMPVIRHTTSGKAFVVTSEEEHQAARRYMNIGKYERGE